MFNSNRFQKIVNKITAGVEEPKVAVKAAFEINSADVCPYCKKSMRLTTARGVPVYLCDDDRTVLPAPNHVEANPLISHLDFTQASVNPVGKGRDLSQEEINNLKS